MLTSEELFFHYSGVCSEILVGIGSMTQEKYERIRKCIDEDEIPSREILEDYYPAAFTRIKKLAGKMGIEDYWDIRVIREYWHNEHNKIIDAKDGNYARFPPVFCDYCKTYIAEVIKNLPNGAVLVKYGDVERPVSPKKYLGELKTEDKVWIHQSEAVERA